MKFLILTLLINLIVLVQNSYSQSRKELEEQRKKTMEEIAYVDKLLKETEKLKTTGLNELRVLKNKINLQELVINGLSSEAELLRNRIEINTLAIELMENDLEKLKDEYRKTVINSWKTSKGYPAIVYVLSAKDFNQGYKRIKYLQQLSRFRRNEAEIIYDLKSQIEGTKIRLKEDLSSLVEIKRYEEKQRQILKAEQERKSKVVTTLSKREKQLKQELERKKRVAQRIESEISRLIEEERKKSLSMAMTPEMKLIESSFEGNKGRLPWPVEKGIITGGFGVQKHKELAFVTENNPGIEITGYGETKVRSVFKGEVARVLTITGANMAVIIRHGNYFTVYQNLVNVRVKAGDKVETREIIADAYCDIEKEKISVIKFMIFKEKEKLDPEQWIAKNR